MEATQTKQDSTVALPPKNNHSVSKDSCQECRQQLAVYQCPRCSWRSCSLTCCVAHKKRLPCSGKRDRTSFLPLSRMSDQTVTSDYFFLEDVLGRVQSGKRLLRELGSIGQPTNNNNKKMRPGEENDEALPPHPIVQTAETKILTVGQKISALSSSSASAPLSRNTGGRERHHNHDEIKASSTQWYMAHPKWKCLHQQATSRGIQLLLMPPGMARHKENRSSYNKGVIVWTVESFYYPISSATTTATATTTEAAVTPESQPQRNTQQLLETVPLWETFQKQLNLDTHEYTLLLKKLPCPAHQPKYVEISRTATLADALVDMTVFDFPTVYVVPSHRLQEFPRVIRELGNSDPSKTE